MDYSRLRKWLMISLLMAISACASRPTFETEGVDQSLTPNAVVERAGLSFGQTILWGGLILGTQNLQASTQIEVLAYPLHSSQRPLLEAKSLGRFILRQAGFLEPNTYAPGRWLTVLGQVESLGTGQIGESVYRYPVVQAQQIRLWPRTGTASHGNVFFGIGINVHN